VVVFLHVGDESFASGMPPADPDSALNLHGDHQIRPGEIEAPLAGGVKAVLGNRLGKAEAAQDLGEGHAWDYVVKALNPHVHPPFTCMPKPEQVHVFGVALGGLASRTISSNARAWLSFASLQ